MNQLALLTSGQDHNIRSASAREMNHAIQQLERDLVLADYSIAEFQDMLSRILTVIQTRRHPCEENRVLLTEFGRLAISLSEEQKRNELINLINDNWDERPTNDITSMLFKIFKTMSHGNECEKLPITDCIFRFIYSDVIEVKHRNLKKQYIIVYINNTFNFCSLENLNNRKYTECADVILVASNNLLSDEIIGKINKITNNLYWLIPLMKEDLIKIVTADNSSDYFYRLLDENII